MASLASELVDKVLAHVTTSVAGVTVRNALTETFKSEDEIGTGSFPWCQGFNVSSASAAGQFGQRETLYELNFELVDAPDLGDATWVKIQDIRSAILADWALTDSTVRSFISAAEVDETSYRDRTVAVFQVTCAVVE